MCLAKKERKEKEKSIYSSKRFHELEVEFKLTEMICVDGEMKTKTPETNFPFVFCFQHFFFLAIL